MTAKTHSKKETQMQSHLIDLGKKELRWGKRGVGQFYTVPERKTYEVHIEPWDPLSTDNFAFEVLKGRLSNSGLDHVISNNGTVKVIVPHGQKFGYVLGWVAWVFDTLTLEDRLQ